LALVAIAVIACLGPRAEAATTLKFATLLPQNTPWGRELKKWAGLVSSDTNGDLQIDFQWNGQAGDEVLMVQKIRAGQLDGAIVSAAGLAGTGVTDALIFQFPGLFSDWSQLDAARAAVADDLEKEFEQRGFMILGWGDAGAIRTMTVGYEVHHPGDLRGKGMFVIPGDPIGPVLFATIGGITPRSLGIPDIMPGLQSGAVTFLPMSALLAEQLQFAPRITHMASRPFAFAVGGFLGSSSRMQSLPQHFKDVMSARGQTLQSYIGPLVRKMDVQSFERLKATKTVYDLTDAERREWKDVFERTATQLRGSVFTPAIYDRVMKVARQ
jgi:TRAP-type C4-dicarboxylate transport system substrate-binding protein